MLILLKAVEVMDVELVVFNWKLHRSIFMDSFNFFAKKIKYLFNRLIKIHLKCFHISQACSMTKTSLYIHLRVRHRTIRSFKKKDGFPLRSQLIMSHLNDTLLLLLLIIIIIIIIIIMIISIIIILIINLQDNKHLIIILT